MQRAIPTLRSRALVALALWLLPAFSGATAATVHEIQNRLAGIVAHPALHDADVGMCVVSLGTGEILYRYHGDQPLIPASNMKLVTVATAFELLGADRLCPVAEREEPLGSLAARILKPSDNELAEALLQWLPEAVGRPDLTPRQLCAETWGERDLYLQGTRWLDGSGLARSNTMTADFVVALLAYMHLHSRWGAQFAAALPVAGVDGTLKDRMLGTAAQGRVRAKTGTLTGVSALSGYAKTAGGDLLAFSMIMNGYSCATQRVRRLQDMACVAIVELEREYACRGR